MKTVSCLHIHIFSQKVNLDININVKFSSAHQKYFNQRLRLYTKIFFRLWLHIFFANTIIQSASLSNQINVAMRKVSSVSINAGMLSQNFKETVRQFIANDKAFAFMSTVKGTPAY